MFNVLKNHPKISLYLCAILIILIWLLAKEYSSSKPINSHQESFNTAKEKQLTLASKPVKKSKTSTNVEDQEDNINNIFYEKEAKARLIQISRSFANDITYPENSKPIRNLGELNKYTPNQSSASSRATDIKNPQSPRLSIKASKHQYFVGENIIADANIEGISSLQSVKVSGHLLQAGKIIANATIQRDKEKPTSYQLTFTNLTSAVVNHSNTLRLVAQFNIDQQQYEVGTAIRYTRSVAHINYVDEAFVNEAYLHIPIFINTTNIGYHLVSANLYDTKSKKPLVHLSEEKELLSQNDFIELKAHASALKAMGHEGPYELRDMLLTRMPSRPTYVTEYGLIEKKHYPVNGYPFSDYENIAYTDDATQERLDFLNQLGESP